MIHIPLTSGKLLGTCFCIFFSFFFFIPGALAYGDEIPLNLPALKVMTLNLHRGTDESGANQLAGDLALFNTERPDLIALQEVESGHLKTFLSAGYQVIFGPNLNFLPFRFGNAILTRHPILYHRHHYLPSRLEPRGLDEVALEIAGHTVTVLNTHLGLQRNERAVQFEEIQRIISYLSGPVILLGDFNTEPSDDLFTGLKDRFGEIGAGALEAKSFPATRPVYRFDQIWYNDYFQPLRGNVLPWLGSDHLPVEAELKLVKGNPTPQVDEPFIPILPQNDSTLSDSFEMPGLFDSPEIQVGIEAESGSGFSQPWADLLFPLSRHWIIGARYSARNPQYREGDVTMFRVGYTPGSFDLRDYFSLLRIKGHGRFVIYACGDTEESLWLELTQSYRWSPRWETELTIAFKNPETIWRLEQSIYFTEYLSYSLNIDTDNHLSTYITLILP